MPVPPPGLRIGRYVLFDEIASGGMAKVYLGRIVGAGGFARTVAIKRPHEQFAREHEFRAMLIDEARIASRIQHSNVVATLDVVEEGDDMLLVMEYVHGESLARLGRAARAKGGLPHDVLMTIVSQALYGLNAAHEAVDDQGRPLGVVHRDVSPQNILVGVDGVTRVLDFGVAKALGRLQNTASGILKGKLSYMAPEQILGEPVDRRADIWAASVILWEQLVGRPLFRGDNEAATMRQVLDMDIPPPGHVREGIPAVLDELVMRGLARNPADRFATAAELADGLLRVGFATASQVTAVVRELGGSPLSERGRRVADIESRSDLHALTPSPAVAPPAAGVAERQRGRRGPLLIAAAAALLAVGVGALVATRGEPAPKPAASVEEPPAPKPAPEKPASEPSESVPAPVPSPSASVSAKPKSGSPATTAKKSTKPSCDPPYTTDLDGIRIPKMECL